MRRTKHNGPFGYESVIMLIMIMINYFENTKSKTKQEKTVTSKNK